jgi:hypothetical protein
MYVAMLGNNAVNGSEFQELYNNRRVVVIYLY